MAARNPARGDIGDSMIASVSRSRITNAGCVRLPSVRTPLQQAYLPVALSAIRAPFLKRSHVCFPTGNHSLTENALAIAICLHEPAVSHRDVR